ncbi:hypothetical protein [Rhizobium rhizogenes]|uniref:hypothetical protein n=1 Tax=Rhizobium rhizogenes TaxID=359 RepID=UPI0015722FA0|nr:hypothetical protein [Rhizobium rhizogenes]NTF47022.1 hypothetical protein [Rhizobium rhizogenes]
MEVDHGDIAKILNHVRLDASIADQSSPVRCATCCIPAPAAKHLTSINTTTRNGVFEGVSDLVERLTGTPPRSFRDFLVVNRDALLAAAKPQK